jgi:hypothetical protein
MECLSLVGPFFVACEVITFAENLLGGARAWFLAL